MYSIVLAEGEGGIGWMAWVALAVFFVMVFLGWWVAQKGWLKQEEEPVHDAHGHEPAAQPQEPAHDAREQTSAPQPQEPAHDVPEQATAPQEEERAHAKPDPAATKADDLTTLEGIGPKVAQLLAGIGITTFQQLAEADLAKLREALDAAGYKYMEPAGWVEQAALAAKGDAEGLKKLQKTLKGGRKAA